MQWPLEPFACALGCASNKAFLKYTIKPNDFHLMKKDMSVTLKLNTILLHFHRFWHFALHEIRLKSLIVGRKSRKLGKLIATKWTLIALALLLNAITIVLFYVLPPVDITLKSANLLCFLVELPAVITVLAELLYMRFIIKRKWTAAVFNILRHCLWLALLGLVVAKLVCTVSGGNKDPLYMGTHVAQDISFSFSARVGLLLIQSISIFCDFIVIFTCWAFKDKFSLSFFCLALGVGFIMGVVKIYFCVKNIPHKQHVFAFLFYFILVEALLMAGTFLVFSLAFISANQNRLSKVMKKLITIVNFYYLFLLLLESTKLSLSIHWLIKHSDFMFEELSILSAITVVVEAAVLVGAKLVCTSPSPGLLVETLDLYHLKPNHKEAFAKLIDCNSKANPGISGNEILSLMEAYCSSNLQDVEFMALRVYTPLKDEDARDLSYEKMQSWRNLDEESNIFGLEPDIEVPEEILKIMEPMSKNQRKRLAKKANAAKKGKESVTFPVNEIKTEVDFEEEKEFYEKLMSTEAIILLTKIKDYDLTASVDSKLLRIVGRVFGKQSVFKLLCINFGLLGFHWPFRRSTFYCSSTKHPVARSAAVMKAVSMWNKALPRRQRMSVLLDPTYGGDNSSKAIPYGGWISTVLPSSNIIDLRPHKSKTVTEYFKAVKYRSQSEAFFSAGGEIVEDHSFSEALCDSAIILWQNIASSHEQNGYSSYLANPDSNFIRVIGTTANDKNNRSLLFLQVDGVCIASCILFRLGDTITSDIQGLDHENGKKHRAYFVMMEAVIKIAIAEGKNFIDFGPTTDKPKRDIGCQRVPLVGGLSTSSSMLSPFVQLAAKKVKV